MNEPIILLFYNIDFMIANFSFSKLIERLLACISMPSLHPHHASVILWRRLMMQLPGRNFMTLLAML